MRGKTCILRNVLGSSDSKRVGENQKPLSVKEIGLLELYDNRYPNSNPVVCACELGKLDRVKTSVGKDGI